MGNSGVIGPGDVQWMTAGSGIIHQEMPQGDSAGRMGGFQLWANLPASQKMMDPRYRDVKSSQIPVITKNDGTVIRIIAGEVEGTQGPVRDIITDPEYLDVTLPAGAEFSHPTKTDHTVLAYVIDGQAYFDPERQILMADGELARFETGVEGSRFCDRCTCQISIAFRQTDRRAGCLVWPNCHEHSARAGDRLRRISQWHFYQAQIIDGSMT